MVSENTTPFIPCPVSVISRTGFILVVLFREYICFRLIWQGIRAEEPLTNSEGLFYTLSTMRELKDYPLRKTVSIILGVLSSGELKAVRWILGPEILEGALTMYTFILFNYLNV